MINIPSISNEPDWFRFGMPMSNEVSDERFGINIFSWEEIEHRMSINLDTIELSSWFKEVPDKYKEEIEIAVEEVSKRYIGMWLKEPQQIIRNFSQDLSKYIEFNVERKW